MRAPCLSGAALLLLAAALAVPPAPAVAEQRGHCPGETPLPDGYYDRSRVTPAYLTQAVPLRWSIASDSEAMPAEAYEWCLITPPMEEIRVATEPGVLGPQEPPGMPPRERRGTIVQRAPLTAGARSFRTKPLARGRMHYWGVWAHGQDAYNGTPLADFFVLDPLSPRNIRRHASRLISWRLGRQQLAPLPQPHVACRRTARWRYACTFRLRHDGAVWSGGGLVWSNGRTDTQVSYRLRARRCAKAGCRGQRLTGAVSQAGGRIPLRYAGE
jgi:hypothetical protein